MASHRGLRTDAPNISKIGIVWLTTGTAEHPEYAGTDDGLPVNGAWPDIDEHVEVPGSTHFGPTGVAASNLYPRREADGDINHELGREITLVLSRYDRTLLDLLKTLARTNATSTLVIRHRSGTFTADCTFSRGASGPPLEARNADHPFHGARGRELVIRMHVVSGGTWS